MDEPAVELTEDQVVEDIATRMESFRTGMASLIQSTNIYPDVAMNDTHQVGIALIDSKFKLPQLNERARQVALKRFQDVSDATPLPDPTPEEAAALDEMLSKEGDEIPKTTEGSAS